MVQLEWIITFPGKEAITILYTNDSDRNSVDYLLMNITTTLTQYISDRSVESEIWLMVLRNVSMNGTLLECRSEDLDSENDTVYVNISGIH